LRHLRWNATAVPPLISHHLPSCLLVPCSCHNYSMVMPASELRTRFDSRRRPSPAPFAESDARSDLDFVATTV
jgi:hypothetical protein